MYCVYESPHKDKKTNNNKTGIRVYARACVLGLENKIKAVSLYTFALSN